MLLKPNTEEAVTDTVTHSNHIYTLHLRKTQKTLHNNSNVFHLRVVKNGTEIYNSDEEGGIPDFIFAATENKEKFFQDIIDEKL